MKPNPTAEIAVAFPFEAAEWFPKGIWCAAISRWALGDDLTCR
jgi:hypothetical protein